MENKAWLNLLQILGYYQRSIMIICKELENIRNGKPVDKELEKIEHWWQHEAHRLTNLAKDLGVDQHEWQHKF